MSKLTKLQAKAHQQACDLLAKDALSEDDKEFVFRNWFESATHVNSSAGAFFTPFDLAMDFALDAGRGRVIDLCAGIGMLSYAVLRRARYGETPPRLTCVEINPAYVEVGRKLVPDAEWICASVFDVLGMGLGRFDSSISNPPFGAVNRHGGSGPRYSGSDFEFHVIDIASQMSGYGTFLLPQMSAGFTYSGCRSYERTTSGKAAAFQKATGLTFDAGCGVDTSVYRKDWRGVSPLCEVVCVEFDVAAPAAAEPMTADTAPPDGVEQLSLFGAAA